MYGSCMYGFFLCLLCWLKAASIEKKPQMTCCCNSVSGEDHLSCISVDTTYLPKRMKHILMKLSR